MMTIDAVAAAVEQVESRGQWYAESGCHRGVMQVCTRWSKLPAARLWLPDDNRREGKRLLAYWYGQRHDWAFALAAYRCGWAGLRGECGQGYARKVLGLLLLLLCACDPDKPAPPAPDAVYAAEVVDPYGDNEP